MPCAQTPSFVAGIPLRTTAADEAALEMRLDTARNIYNAELSKRLHRLDLMRESQEWRRARAMPKAAPRSVGRKGRGEPVTWSRRNPRASAMGRFRPQCRSPVKNSDTATTPAKIAVATMNGLT